MKRITVVSLLITAAIALGSCAQRPGKPDAQPSPTLSATTPTVVPSATVPPVQIAPAEPQTLEAAKDAAQRFIDRYTAEDWEGTYDVYSAQVRQLVSRDAYLQFWPKCVEKASGGEPMTRMEARDVRWMNDTQTKVRVTYVDVFGFTAQTRDLIYEDGFWKLVPSESFIQIAESLRKYGASRTLATLCTP